MVVNCNEGMAKLNVEGQNLLMHIRFILLCCSICVYEISST